MPQRKRWSELEIRELIDLISKDMPITRIARWFGVSRQALYKLMQRRHIDPQMHRPDWSRSKGGTR